MSSPTGIIPEAWMYPKHKRDVIEWLKRQPWPARVKVQLLHGWAITVGVRLQQREFHEVEDSGLDL